MCTQFKHLPNLNNVGFDKEIKMKQKALARLRKYLEVSVHPPGMEDWVKKAEIKIIKTIRFL